MLQIQHLLAKFGLGVAENGERLSFTFQNRNLKISIGTAVLRGAVLVATARRREVDRGARGYARWTARTAGGL